MLQTFANALEKYEDELVGSRFWGACRASEILSDGAATVMPSKPLLRMADGHLNQSVIQGLALYTTAIKLYDKLVFYAGHAVFQNDVLKHEKMPFWIGRNIVSSYRPVCEAHFDLLCCRFLTA